VIRIRAYRIDDPKQSVIAQTGLSRRGVGVSAPR